MPMVLAKLGPACVLPMPTPLFASLQFCAAHGIGCFRINSQILPLKDAPSTPTIWQSSPEAEQIISRFRDCGAFARVNAVRTCFHPDQFVVLNSQRPEVVEASIRELEYQAEVAEWVAADVINIHGGGAFGDKPKALADFARGLDRLSAGRESG